MKHFRIPRLVSVVALLALLVACSQTTNPEIEELAVTATDRYIVVLNEAPIPDQADRGRTRAAEVARAHGLQPTHTYGAAIVGFAAEVPAGRLAALQRDPRVKYVETDDPVEIFAQSTPTGIHRSFASGNTNLDIDGTDDYRVDVDVAVIDTGIDFEHPDLDVVGGVNCSGGGPFGNGCKSGGDDDHYHGTHVAGTIGAIDNGIGVVGIAPGARLWAVKVLDSSGRGYESWIVAGIDWVAANAGTIEVANMSLGGSGFSQAEYDAIQTAVNLGVAFAVAAGNSNDDASKYSPAAFDNVLTVSALADFDGAAGGKGSPTCRADQDDTLADFSNWGTAVQIAAPGVCILSTYPIEQGEYGTISGTSMASPHAAGALALLASSNNPSNATDVYNLYNQVISSGNFDWTDDSGDGIHERLLDMSSTTLYAPTLIAGSGGGTTNTPPTASFTHTCTDLTCSFDGSGSSDADGSISSYAWNFGDSSSATGITASHTYAAGGTYTVTLTVTDNNGATDSEARSVTVSGSAGGISLTATGYKVKGWHTVDLEWSGATTRVDIYRDGRVVATTDNDGLYTDSINNKGGGSYVYRVCETGGTSNCSPNVTVVF